MKNILPILFILSFFQAFSQTTTGNPSTNSNGQVVQVQPKIMVVPFTKEGQDIRTILESDVNKRIAVTVVKQAFDDRGFTTIDFTARLKAAMASQTFSSENQSDFKTMIIENSGADIYVEVEVDQPSCSGGNKARIIITAYFKGTGASLSNKVGDSPCINTQDFGKLVQKAVESCVEDFLNVMQNKFSDIVENGQSVYLEVGLDQNSEYDMNTEIGEDGLPLADVIEMWMEENAYKNQYSLQGVTDKKIIFEDIRIPLLDQATGRNYTPRRFSLELVKFFKQLGLSSVRQEDRNKIYFTIK